VFFGTVRRSSGSNVAMLESDEYPTAVVHVDEVVTSPEAVGDLTGHELTVHLSEPRAPSRGSRHLFMATSLYFGDEIAVAEIGRVPRGRIEQELRRAILEEKLRELDNALAERLSLAAAVLYGVVLRIDSATPEAAGTPEPVGEAMPAFRAAVLTVWRTLKGRLAEEEPRVVFPFPRTQKWSEVPLFVEGEEGVWILQPARGQTLAGGTVKVPDVANGYTALDPLDFHAPGLIGRIEALLASTEAQASGRRSGRR
jgi:hypothetical protein